MRSKSIQIVWPNMREVVIATETLEFWKEFDLEGKRVILDNNCVEMRELKEASVEKRLIEISKKFRRKSN